MSTTRVNITYVLTIEQFRINAGRCLLVLCAGSLELDAQCHLKIKHHIQDVAALDCTMRWLLYRLRLGMLRRTPIVIHARWVQRSENASKQEQGTCHRLV